MLEDEKLAIDESRKIAQREAVKGAVRNEVHSEIAQERLIAHRKTAV